MQILKLLSGHPPLPSHISWGRWTHTSNWDVEQNFFKKKLCYYRSNWTILSWTQIYRSCRLYPSQQTFLRVNILTGKAPERLLRIGRVASLVGVPVNPRATAVALTHLGIHASYSCGLIRQFIFHMTKPPPVAPTYAANGQAEAHSVQHGGGDCAVVERVLDAVVITEKAPLIGTDLTQVKGRQRQASCGWRDREEEQVKYIERESQSAKKSVFLLWKRKRQAY